MIGKMKKGAYIVNTARGKICNRDAIDRSEDRKRFQEIISKLSLLQPKNATVSSLKEALNKSDEIGYPIVVRPSYVLGGRAMELVNNKDELGIYISDAVQASNERPILLDHYLDNAIAVSYTHLTLPTIYSV